MEVSYIQHSVVEVNLSSEESTVRASDVSFAEGIQNYRKRKVSEDNP